MPQQGAGGQGAGVVPWPSKTGNRMNFIFLCEASGPRCFLMIVMIVCGETLIKPGFMGSVQEGRHC